MNKKIIHVIPHTHWDFEWYFTHPESSIQLVYHMDDLLQALELGQINHYVLDGQLSIIEDYLNLVPENKEKLIQWVKKNKLLIGPWYTQCDQLVISGESIVRNLLLGMRCAENIGVCWKIGYVPDAFGQSIDMPKIYNGFGIRKSVFWRGLSQDKCPTREFRWASEDGSEVFCYQIRNGYYLAEPQLSSMAADSIVEMIAKNTSSQHIPMPFGADQIKVDMNLQQRISTYNSQTQLDHKFIESTYDTFFDCIAEENLELPSVHGEMIDAQFSKIHRSIYSTRYDHKQLNDTIETRITLILEPLMLIANHFAIPYKQSLINEIWKQLLRCHAHDSAGGCNSDRTNNHILQRLISANEMSSASVDYLVHKLSESIVSDNGLPTIVIYNTLPYSRRHNALIELDTEKPCFTILDNDKNEIEYSVLTTEKRYRGSIRRNSGEHDEALYYFHHKIELGVTLPSLGFKTYTLLEQENYSTKAFISKQKTNYPIIENSCFRIELFEGELTLTNKKTLKKWTNFLSIRDMGDDGDNYDYSPPEKDWILHLDFLKAETSTDITNLSQTLNIKGSWKLPADLNERANKNVSRNLRYHFKITLTNDQPIEVQLEIDNQANDHRMQMIIDSQLLTNVSIADTPFGTIKRPHLHERMFDWMKKGWKEEPSCIYPLIHFVSLSQKDLTITALCCGIKEYEILQQDKNNQSGESGTLALTLFRSVGWLGKPELKRRPGIASGQQFKYIATPDSQLMKTMSFRIGILFSEEFNPAKIMKHWQQFSVPALSYQQQELNRFTNSMKYFGVNPLTQSIPNEISLIEVDTTDLVVSAIKLAETNNEKKEHDKSIIVRLFNPLSQEIMSTGNISLPNDYDCASNVQLNEQVEHTLPINNGKVQLGRFKPKQIKSYKFSSATQKT